MVSQTRILPRPSEWVRELFGQRSGLFVGQSQQPFSPPASGLLLSPSCRLPLEDMICEGFGGGGVVWAVESWNPTPGGGGR